MCIVRGIFFDGVTDRSRVAGQTCGSRGYIRQIDDWVAVRVGEAPLEGNGLTGLAMFSRGGLSTGEVKPVNWKATP